MSKPRNAEEQTFKRQAEGCCCGGSSRRNATEVNKTAADAGSMAEHDVHRDAHEPQGKGGCCGGTRRTDKTTEKTMNKFLKKTSHIICIAGALAGLVASSAIEVLAQGQMPHQMPSTGMTDKGMMGMMRMMADCPMMDGDMAVHADGRIAFLKAELGITDAQKVVWDAYAAAITKNLQGMQATRQIMTKTMATTSPVERLENHIAAMESRASALKEIKPALGNLYGLLRDEQKRKADQLLTGMGCMM